MNLTNWAGNLTYGARDLICPGSVDELRDIVRGSRSLRALGSKHSFNEIADTSGDLVSLQNLPREIVLSPDRSTVTVGGAVSYGELCPILEGQGCALRNLASLPHISVAGACATATHGSGVGNGNLATSVAAMEFVTPEGSAVKVSRESGGDQFAGTVVHLGALGIVTRITLDVVPTYRIAQSVYDRLPFSALSAHFDEIMSSAYSVSLFTTWRSGDVIDQVWTKRMVASGEPVDDAPSKLFGATLADSPRHPIGDVSAVNCTEQLGVPGPWHDRLPHFRFEHTPSHGEELQTEYFVARQDAAYALDAVGSLRERIAPLLLVSEIRAVAADSLWLSPMYGRDSVGIHFTWKPDWPQVKELLPEIEACLAPFDARPHWAKLFTMPGSQIRNRYEKLPEFIALMQDCDPGGKLGNEYIRNLIVDG